MQKRIPQGCPESQTDSRYDGIAENNTPENEIKSLSGVSKFDTHKQRKRIILT